MKLSDAQAIYADHSRQASTVCRQLAFAGIAIIWIFRSVAEEPGEPLLPREFLGPGALIVLALAADLLQYAWASAIWGRVSRRMEQTGNTEDAPAWVNWPTDALFWLKIVCVMIAYIWLGAVLFGRLF
jgi:hypothetical protein